MAALLLAVLAVSDLAALLLTVLAVSDLAALLLTVLAVSDFTALLLLALVASADTGRLAAVVAVDGAALFISLVLLAVAVLVFSETVSACTSTVDNPPATRIENVAIAAKTNFLPSLYIL